MDVRNLLVSALDCCYTSPTRQPDTDQVTHYANSHPVSTLIQGRWKIGDGSMPSEQVDLLELFSPKEYVSDRDVICRFLNLECWKRWGWYPDKGFVDLV